LNILGASTPPLRHKMWLLDSLFMYPMPTSAILSFKFIFYDLLKKEIEYLVSPKRSAICSAIAIALSFAPILISTVYLFSSLSITLTLSLT